MWASVVSASEEPIDCRSAALVEVTPDTFLAANATPMVFLGAVSKVLLI
jgi:hypothetical protein